MLLALAERAIRPDLVLGTSVGAVNAAWFAGRPDLDGVRSLADVWRSVRRSDVFPLDPRAGVAGLLGRRNEARPWRPSTWRSRSPSRRTATLLGMPTTVYTDGACLGNPGPGGWAWAVPGGPYRSGAEPMSTNQRMEIAAVLDALRSLEGKVHVLSDSTYVVNCFRDRWWEGWIRRGWTSSQRKPVANRDLWEPLIELYLARRGELTFQWVKGHGEDAVNDLVDRLAFEAARAQQGRSGTGMPAGLGPADVPSGPGVRDPRLPEGRLIVVGGNRPPELGGYGDNAVARRVRGRLAEILTAKKTLHPEVFVLTGLNLGAEQLGALAATDAGVPCIAVLAYPELESMWPPSSQESFRALLDGAERTVLLQMRKPTTRQQAAGLLLRRNGWLAAQADEAVIVWDGKDETIGRFVRALEGRLGEDVWVVDPRD